MRLKKRKRIEKTHEIRLSKFLDWQREKRRENGDGEQRRDRK